MQKKNVSRLDKSLKLLVKTSLMVFILIFLSRILGYVYRIIIARQFGPEVYGLFSLALMVSGFFIAFSALGFSEGILRFVSLYRGKKQIARIKYLFKFGVIIASITSILAGLLLFLLANFISVNLFHNPALSIYLKIFSIVIPISVLGGFFLIVLRAHEKIVWHSSIANLFQGLIKVASLGIFVLLGFNSNAVSLSYLAGVFGVLVISYCVCKYKIPHIFGATPIKHDEKRIIRKELVSYSIPILFFSIISTIFYWIDSFSLGYYKGAISVGWYNAAVPIALLLGIIPELFMQLFFPLITKLYARKNLKLIEQLGKQVAKWILLVNIPIFAIMIVFPGAIINLLFGSEYLVAENALRILSVGSLISSILIISNQLISMIGKSKLILMNIVIAATINLVLNSILVPIQKIGFIENSSGLNGAAIATLISVVIFNLMFMAEAHRYLSIIPLKRKMINVIISAVISTAFLVYARTIFTSSGVITLGALSLSFLLVYISLVWASGSFDRNDLFIIKSIKNKIVGIK